MTQILNATPKLETHFDLVEIVRLLWHHRWVIILGCLIGALLGVGTSAAVRPLYQAKGDLVVRSAALMSPDPDRAFDTAVVNEAVVKTEKDVLTSEGLLRRVTAQVDIPPQLISTDTLLQRLRTWLDFSGLLTAGLRADLDDIISPPAGNSPQEIQDRRTNFLSRAITIVTNKDSSVIAIHAVTRDPQISADIVNSVMRLYMQDRADEESRAARVIETALRERLKQTRQQIDEGENRMVQLLQQAGTLDNSEIPGQLQRMALLGQELVRVQVELARRKASYNSGDYGSLQATVDALQHQMDQERQQRQRQSSSNIGLNAQRDAVASLWRVSDTLEARLIDLAAHPMNLNARILSLAELPLRPSFPSKLIFAAAGTLVIGLGTTTCLLTRNHMRGRRPLAGQFAQMMNVRFLGGVPQMSGFRARHQRILDSAVGANQSNCFTEALFAMALELEDAVKEDRLRCIMVTSAHSDEGKTTVAVALGKALASMSMRVLLIDLDLRRPSAEKILLAADPAAFESKSLPFGGHTVQISVDRPTGLQIITPFPAGCPNPLGYLRSASLREAIHSARTAHDLLVFDAPPILSVPDALVIARLADSTVLVAELGRSNDAEAAEMARLLDCTHRPVFGVIVTKVPADSLSYGEYGASSQYRA